MADLALKLGGYDRLRKHSLPQIRNMLKAKNKEQIFQAKIHGCEIKDDAEKSHYATSSDIAALKAFVGKR